MNRHQRMLGRMHQTQYEARCESAKDDSTEIQEVLPPKHRRSPIFNVGRFTTNKCCDVTPNKTDFGQTTEDAFFDMYQNICLKTSKMFKNVQEQDDSEKPGPETIEYLKELRKLLCKRSPKVDHSMQCFGGKESMGATHAGGSRWQTIDCADNVDKYIEYEKGSLDSFLSPPQTVSIADTPRIKIIANKFSRFKKNNIELRKLEEKVVCLEYDVFVGDGVQPVEKLRAFFSIKPTEDSEHTDKEIPHVESIPSIVKNKFNIASEDLRQLHEKEIEIIDGQIEQNKTYLEDLKRILKRTQAINCRKNSNSLDLVSLYEMAKRQMAAIDDRYSNTNILTTAELQEIKELIIKKCVSSVHGINRRTVRKNPNASYQDIGVISQSIVAELWREGNTV